MDRLEKQRMRQREYRARKKREQAPSRDDIARTLLHWAITENIRRGREEALFRLQVQVVDQLVTQGFGKAVSDAAFDHLVDRYRAGWSFQRKIHLRSPCEGEDEGG